jgi:hypothetical protein
MSFVSHETLERVMGRPPIGDHAMTAAERQRRYRDRQATTAAHDPELLAKKLEPYLVVLRYSREPAVAVMAAKLEAVLVEFGVIPARAEAKTGDGF